MFLAALVVGLTVPLVFTKQASAAYARCNPDGTGSGGSGSLRCGPANSQEIAALASCGSATNRAGAIWISNNSTSYYAAEVNVANGAVSVPVVIRGSVNNCAGTWSTVTGAKNISSTSGRISGIPDTSSSSPTVLNRGTSPGSPYAWSGQGGSLPATLNVAGLAVAPPYKETITIPLYRCFYDISLQEYGTTCGTAYIPVTIIRDAPPPKVWSISGTTSVAISGDGTASPGNKITWTHKVTNDGPDATTTSISSWSARSDGWSGTRDTGSSSGAK